MLCPRCGEENEKVYVEAPATVVTVRRVIAEIDLDVDLRVDDRAVTYSSSFRDFQRVLVSPRIDDADGEVLDSNLDIYGFELDATDGHGGRDVHAYCFHCSGDITDAFYEELEKRVPRYPDPEPIASRRVQS